MVGPSGLEPPTSRLSGVRSNQLSYGPTGRASVGGSARRPGHSLPQPELVADRRPNGRPSCNRREKPRRPTGPTSRLQLQAPERETTNSARTRKSGSLTWKLPIRSARRPRRLAGLPRKEVIQPHLPVRLPCYDLAPITDLTLGVCPLTVGVTTSGAADFRGLTGGVYKARERIHRCLLISDY